MTLHFHFYTHISRGASCGVYSVTQEYRFGTRELASVPSTTTGFLCHFGRRWIEQELSADCLRTLYFSHREAGGPGQQHPSLQM